MCNHDKINCWEKLPNIFSVTFIMFYWFNVSFAFHIFRFLQISLLLLIDKKEENLVHTASYLQMSSWRKGIKGFNISRKTLVSRLLKIFFSEVFWLLQVQIQGIWSCVKFVFFIETTNFPIKSHLERSVPFIFLLISKHDMKLKFVVQTNFSK